MAGHLMMLLLQGGGGTTPSQFDAEYLVVAGGGVGGTVDPEAGVTRSAGGGGAGGLLSGSAFSISLGVAISVAVGGQAQNSTLGDLTAIAGGAGGSIDDEGNSSAGGSGGSGGGGAQPASGTVSGGSGTSGQGSAGGEGNVNGGGAGGGNGTSSSITGASVVYATGGPANETVQPVANTGNGGSSARLDPSSGFVVSGAGTSDADGLYVPDGTHLGFTKYRRGESNWYIVIFPAQYWAIATFDGDIYTAQYSLNFVPADPEDEEFIPTVPEGPAFVELGDAPAPTFLPQIVAVSATGGSSGVVVIAYPDTFPALSSINGLTYDEPSRAGYRVYRFTAGSGTITP
jgi:hypothetical protein